MYWKNRVWWYIVLLLAGVALFLAGCFEALDDYWAGFGGGLVGVSAIRLYHAAKYHRNPEYARKIEIANKDERLRFISDKARSVTLLVTVLVLCILGLVLRPMGFSSYADLCYWIVCGTLVVYWISYIILSKKY